MKGDFCYVHTLSLYFFKKLFSKMQPCRRGCCTALILCIYGLIPVFIFKLMCDIRRQRHFSEFIKYFLKYTLKLKFYMPVTCLIYIDYFRLQKPLSKVQSISYPAFFTRFYKTFPNSVAKSFKQKYLNLSP